MVIISINVLTNIYEYVVIYIHVINIVIYVDEFYHTNVKKLKKKIIELSLVIYPIIIK